MKPMKVMRYKGSYRYQMQRRKRIWKTVLALVLALVVVFTAAFVVYAFAVRQKPAPAEDVEEELTYILKNDDMAEISLPVGELCMLTLPPSVDITKVKFLSSDAKVLRVDSAGRVDGLKEGKAKVTAVAGDDFFAECVFHIEKAPAAKKQKEVTTAYAANLDVLYRNIENPTRLLYSLTVNRRTNTVTVYTYDENGNYTVPVRAMVCSCGAAGADETPLGDYAIGMQKAWLTLNGDAKHKYLYGMYVSQFSGDFLFHSVPYVSMKHDDLESDQFNLLSTSVSQGCVRLMASDAHWIFRHCERGTPVHVIDKDASADPLGTPPAVKIDEKVKWDPTDQVEKNPYTGKKPTIEGAKDITIKQGDSFDPLKGIKAKDICGNDITDRVHFAGEVIPDKPGVYYLTYSVKDDFRLKTTVERKITVEAKE